MKQKCNKTIVIKFFAIIFVVFLGLFANVFAQYYYFSSGGNTYQQGCNEVLQVRVNSEGQNVRAGRFHLVLDPLTTIYPKTDNVIELREFFGASTDSFIQWTSEGSPSWKGGSDYTILKADRNNGTQDYNGTNKLYANVNFKPVFSGSVYNIVFGMEYVSGTDTTETTLSLAGGSELINPIQQELYRTGNFMVLQEPCVSDTKKPTVENVSIINNSTKVSYLSGLTFSLKDEGGSNGIGNVPYIWSGGEWTGNVGGLITNQYGIDATMFSVTLIGNGHSSEIIRINDAGVNTVWDKMTWQDTGLNLNVSISSGGLFDFGIEKQISAAIVVYDRAGNHDTKIITFNKPKGPELISDSVSPKNNDIYVNLSAPINLGIKDDWAGVDSGTIKITVYGINGTAYGPYVFSGVDLNLSGVQGNANELDYYINIANHEEFPTSGTIKVEVYAKDMEGTVDIIDDYVFSTRPDCTEFQCCDPVWLDLGNEGSTYYYNTGLVVSGGNNPTFSVDAENNTGIIDCNAETDGLSVYSGQDNFVFFTDKSVLTILGTGVKGVLSGDVLTLSYIIKDSQVVIDRPYDTESLSTGNVDIQWHLTGVENQDDWLSGYILQVYSGDDVVTGGFVNTTGVIESFLDGEYDIAIYPVDILGNTGSIATGKFIVDTTGPDFEFSSGSGYECEIGYLEIVGINDLLSIIPSLPYSFDGINWTGNNKVIIDSQNTTGFVLKTGYVRDSLGNISEKLATYEFIDTGIFVDVNDLDLGVLVGDFTTGVLNLYESFGAREGDCGIENLGISLNYCVNATGNISEGNLQIIPEPYFEGNGECNVKITDDDGNENIVSISFEVDTKASSCVLLIQNNQCTSGEVVLLLTGDDISGYNWDGSDNWMVWHEGVITGVTELGVYNGYVIDGNGNISGCNVEVTGGILDLDNPTLNVSNWTGYECSTGSITVTGNDNSCGINGLYYGWEGIINTTNTNEVYSENPGSQVVQVFVYDGVGHSDSEQLTYTWQDIPVTGHDFTVENVGTGITVDWYVGGNVSAGICELQNIVATTNNSKCSVNGHNITYIPDQGFEGGEDCVINVTDGDGEGINIHIIFTGVDRNNPTVQLSGGVGEQCTSLNTFTVTGMFNEHVEGVTTNILQGDNVNILDFTGNGNIYEWTVEMQGGTGKVWIDSGVLDLVGNECEGSNILVLGNYDNIDPQSVFLLLPGSGEYFINRTISFEWTSSNDEGCAGLSGYILNICRDSSCNDVAESVFTDDTGATITLQSNGTYYWTVIPIDVNGNAGMGGTGYFDVESSAPECSIAQGECSNSSVNLMLTGNKAISVVSGNVSWLKIGESSYTSEISENINVWTIVSDIDGETGYCHLTVTNYDNYGPNINFVGIDVNEGEPLNIDISAVDSGCAGISGYIFGISFGSGNRQTLNRLRVTAEQIGRTGGIERDQVITVIDNFGNITVRTGKITIRDVKPTLSNSTGMLNGVHTGDFVVDIVDFFGAVEGNGICGTGDLMVEVVNCVYATGRVSGHNLIVDLDENADGLGSCSLRIKDNEGSYSDVDGLIEFAVKTTKPVCSGLIYEPEGWSSGSSVTVYLTGCSEPILGTGYHIFTGNGGYTFEFEDLYGNTGSLFAQYTGFDRESPVFNFNSNSGYECQTGILTISNVVDSGIGLADLPYSFDGINRSTGNTRELYFAGSTGISVLGYVRDGLGNQNEAQAEYIFNNSIPTATGFTVGVLRGVDVNWKELSHASDGACGSGVLFASVTGGSIGHCLVSGDILSYTSNDTSVTGVDNCELTIYDDEGSFVEINVELTDINEYPYIELVQPENGKIIDSGKISLSWTGVGNSDLIFGYVYRVWNASDELVFEQTGSDVIVDLSDGSYNWNVYAKYVDGTTGGLTDTYSFNIVIPQIPSGSQGGGGGRYGLRKDKCPNGDLSDSYYDGTCEANGGVHGSAGSDFCGIMKSTYSNEQKGAYLYSYTYGITTLCPIQIANLDGYLIRSHFAKMISEFAVNVLGNKPEKGKEGCDKFDDIDKLSDELYGFVITACELGLMGLEPDGVTPSKSFNPDNRVTRAQFGTVFSRLLFGDMYNVKDGEASTEKGSWYKDHLQALKRYGIMTKIDGDRPTYLERRGWVMIMLQRSDYYGVFAGKVPAKNGIEALFSD